MKQELIIDYDIEFYYWNGSTYVKGIPSGVSSIDLQDQKLMIHLSQIMLIQVLEVEDQHSSLLSPPRPSIPLEINVNSSNINVNNLPLGDNYYSMSCAPDRNFSSQERYRSDKFTITPSDTLYHSIYTKTIYP